MGGFLTFHARLPSRPRLSEGYGIYGSSPGGETYLTDPSHFYLLQKGTSVYHAENQTHCERFEKDTSMHPCFDRKWWFVIVLVIIHDMCFNELFTGG
jgi:hypothetical protein